QMLGATYAEIGAYLLGLWGLPDPIVEAVAWQHSLDQCPAEGFSPIIAVHVADALTAIDPDAPEGQRPTALLDETNLNRLGLGDRLPVWRDLLHKARSEGELQ